MVFDPASLTAIGSVAGGLGSLGGALFGGGQSSGMDYASLYAAQLAPGQTMLTTAAQQLAALTGPYLQALNTNTSLQASQALGQFNQAAYKDQKLTDLMSGIASSWASSLIGNEDLASKYKTATEFLGPTTAAALTNKYADTASAVQNTVLQGESSALNKITEGQVLEGMEASKMRNRLAGDIASTNLRIRERQEDTKNALALQRGEVEGRLALKRWGAGMATGAAGAYA